MIQGVWRATSCTFGEGFPPWLLVLSLRLHAGGWGASEGEGWHVTHGLVTSQGLKIHFKGSIGSDSG